MLPRPFSLLPALLRQKGWTIFICIEFGQPNLTISPLNDEDTGPVKNFVDSTKDSWEMRQDNGG